MASLARPAVVGENRTVREQVSSGCGAPAAPHSATSALVSECCADSTPPLAQLGIPAGRFSALKGGCRASPSLVVVPSVAAPAPLFRMKNVWNVDAPTARFP